MKGKNHMNIDKLFEIIHSDFYTGVPDSQLKTLCDFLMMFYGINPAHHIIAANEGNAVALAAGYHLATGKVPVVYMQNSGEGNMVNPYASLLHTKVYAIPVLFIIGWRGEPGVHDEPQHIFQGEITVKQLQLLGIDSYIIDKETTEDDVAKKMIEFRKLFQEGRCAALVVKKGALAPSDQMDYKNSFEMSREEIIKHIVAVSGNDPIVSTTGKASRELFEIREQRGETHQNDFLTVGSMGHASSIALEIAIQKPMSKIWCIDGDGALLMHMGAMAVIGSIQPENLIHIVINNGAHETVGGMPTVAGSMDLSKIAEGCGYTKIVSVSTFEDLDRELNKAKSNAQLTFIEVRSSIGARKDLGRPTTTALENKLHFMEALKNLK